MSEENKPEVGDQGAQDGVKSEENKVAYESFQRAVDETKRFKSEAQKLKEELEQLKAQDMERKGSLEEALSTYKDQASQLKQENEKLKTTFAQTQINSRIESELTRRGCKDPSKALRVMDDKDYNALVTDVDDNFKIGDQTLQFVLDKFQKENDFFFGRSAPKFADGVPSKTVERPESEKDSALKKVKEAKTEQEYQEALQAAYKQFK